MNVLQIVDTLNVGGRERMAVNITNSLNEFGVNTYLCVSRKTGLLEEFVNVDKVIYLNRKSTFDIIAIFKVVIFVLKNKIKIIHAHDSAYFLGVIIKLLTNSKLVWHDHYGLSENLKDRSISKLKYFCKFFDHVIVVNSALYTWCNTTLNIPTKKISLLNNFAIEDNNKLENPLPGKNGLSIICVANLRPQKDHFTLLNSFLLANRKDVDLYLVGKDFNDNYSDEVKQFINLNRLDNVYFLGSRTDISAILNECEIGILTSISEGLPVSLLEYGLAQLAVICTDVGQCNQVITPNLDGILVKPKDVMSISQAVISLIDNVECRKRFQINLHEKITTNFSSERFIYLLNNIYKSII